MPNVRHLSFEELADNLTELLDYVRTEHITLVVEYANGEKLMIKPLSPPRQHAREDSADDRSQRQNQDTQRENSNSMGALYDIDPDSITPG